MAFFSKKKHHKDQQAGSTAGANGGGIASGGPAQSQASLSGSSNGAGMQAASQQQQQPAMYVSSSRGEGPTGMAGPSNPYSNGPPFDANMQQQAGQQYGQHQQQQGYNQYQQQQQQYQGQPQQSGYAGSGSLSNGMVGAPSGTPYGQQGQNGSPQQSNYPNGIGISVPSSGSNPAMGPGALPGRNFSANSGNSLGNGHAVGPPLQPLPAPGPQGQAPSSSHHAQSGSHSSPVSYPWSQRPIRLQPIQLARPSGSDAHAPLSTEISPSPFPRYGHSVNPIAQSATGDLYLFGGLVKDEVSNDLFMISCSNPNPTSAQSNESKALAGAPINVSLIETRGERPCARVGHASVSVGNVLIIWGGDTKTKEEDPQDNNLYLLNLGSREWTLVKVTGPSPQGRYGHAAAMRGSKFYIFGGQQDVPPGAPDDAAFLNDLWCFDLQNLKAGKPHWQQIQYAADTPTPPKRTGHTMVNYVDKLYVFGGTDGQYHYNDTWCFSPATNSWSELSCIGYIPVPREGHAATLVDDVVYVFGGRSVDGKDLEDLAAFKISNQRWYMFTNMGPAPSGRSGHAMATWHNKVFVLGGESYTSSKHEWPNMINMLDTGKIKYPSDSRSQQANRKTSNSRTQQQPASSSNQQPNGLSSSANNKPVQNVANDELRRAVSPTGSDRDPGLMRSLDRGNGIANGSPAGSNTSPAQEPRRPATDPRRAMSPINEQQPAADATRSLSPVNNRPVQTSNSFSSMTNGTTAYSTPPTRHDATMNGPANTTSPPNPQLNALRANARSPSPQLMRSIDSHTQQAQPDTFHSALSGSAPSHSSHTPSSSFRDKWMQTALAHAVRQGYSLPADSENMLAEPLEGNKQLFSALLAMKQEIANMRKTMAEEALNAEQVIVQASKGKTAALQEAAFYRAKIAALESNTPNDLVKLERTRISELERKLSETASAKSTLERQLAELDGELNHYRDTAQAAVEREQAANHRAEAAENSYSRSLTEYADLQRRAHVHEASTHDNSSKIATLQSQVERLTAQNEEYAERLHDAEAEVEKHIATLTEVHVSLTSVTNHSSELESLWQKSREELLEQQDKVANLEAELQRTSMQLETSHAQIRDLEKALHATQEEAASLRSLSTGHIQQLLSISRNSSTRNISRGSDDGETSKVLQREVETHRSLAEEAHTRSVSAQTDLREAKAGHAALEKQVTLLRDELAALRSRHASAVEASSRAQALVSQRDLDLRDKARVIETCEVQNGLLKTLLAENGLSADEHGSPLPNGASESSTTLSRKIAELESRLQQRDQAHQELQRMHDDARHEAESAQQRLRRSEEQIDRLSREIQALHLANSNTAGSEDTASKAVKAEADLTALQEKHQQLETTHLKAVQYVKGTEKMFRRMKDELTRYKEQNETLEQELASIKESSEKGHSRKMSTELRPELEDLRAQLTALRQQSDTSSNHNEDLQQHIARLKSEYDQQLSAQQNQTSTKIQECENEIEELREALNKVQQEVEETLAHNKHLEEELQKRTVKQDD